jgi:hypothetical protein
MLPPACTVGSKPSSSRATRTQRTVQMPSWSGHKYRTTDCSVPSRSHRLFQSKGRRPELLWPVPSICEADSRRNPRPQAGAACSICPISWLFVVLTFIVFLLGIFWLSASQELRQTSTVESLGLFVTGSVGRPKASGRRRVGRRLRFCLSHKQLHFNRI